MSCTTTQTSPTSTTPPIPAAGTWRNVTKVLDVPPGDLSVTLRESGTGFLEMPEEYSWAFNNFTWTRQNLNGHFELLSLRGQGTEEPTEMRFSLTFSDDNNVLVHFLVHGETPEPVEPDTPGWTWMFRRI